MSEREFTDAEREQIHAAIEAMLRAQDAKNAPPHKTSRYRTD